MGRLIFPAADLRRVIEHTLNAKSHAPHLVGFDHNGKGGGVQPRIGSRKAGRRRAPTIS